MIQGGFDCKNVDRNDYKIKIKNDLIHKICGTKDVSIFNSR